MKLPFQFKYFSIKQYSSAMKVGTDGVLLGAWTTIKSPNILDIGTGTGLIAIMLAQRNKNVIIDAVEIELDAYLEAKENIANCNWFDKIKAHNIPIQEYKSTNRYDLIVSNPPFFVDSTKAPKTNRNSARHTDSLSFADLIISVIRLLQPNGIFSSILPTNEAEQFIALAEQSKLYLNKKCNVRPNSQKKTKRVLMEFSFFKTEMIESELIIETDTRHQYTKEYITLTKDFYLKF